MKKTALLIGLMLAACAPGHAQDANAVLRKMLATYRGLNSYTQRISSTSQIRLGSRTQLSGLDGEVRYQRPNKIYVSVTNPTMGTFVAASNGREMTIYRGNINSYQKRPAPATIKAFVEGLGEFGVGTYMDPLFFLKGDNLESSFGPATAKGTGTVFGVNCQIVTAPIKPGSMKGIAGGTAIYHIDPASGLTRKIQLRVKGQPARGIVRGTKNGKPVSQPVTLSQDYVFIENVQEVQANPALNDASFTVNIPKGAKLQDVNKPLTGR